MSQISPPMRILLVGAVAFLAAWMLFLKPGDEPQTAATPTPVATPAGAAADPGGPAAGTSMGKAVQGARGAAKQSDAANAAAGSETSSAPSTSPSTATDPAPAPSAAASKPDTPADAAIAKLPEWLQASLDKKVIAILFTNDKAADDRRTRAALGNAYTAHGKVVTRTVDVRRISRYRAVAEGVDVQQSPTLMVIDRDREASALVGYSSVDTINQAIIDGLLATHNPVEKVAYLQKVQSKCRAITNRLIIGVRDGSNSSSYARSLDAVIAAEAAALADLRRAKVPVAYRPLSRQVNRYLASEIAANRQVKATAIKGNTVDAIKARAAHAGNDKLEGRTMLELNAVGVSACN